jgi:hypothetical protein
VTLFGWDASSYDGLISATTAARAHSEGIVFATHRVLRQNDAVDPYAGHNLAAFRDGGIPFIGPYGVVSGDGVADADRLLSQVHAVAPWWFSFPGRFAQVDMEKWPTDPVPASVGIAMARRLRAQAGCQVVLYGSHGQYGDQLAGWDGPLWNARYATTATGPFKTLYPGDNAAGWAAYSGKVPAILQYTSSATIAGVTTCDANAFRGTLDQLRALLAPAADPLSTQGVFMALTDKEQADMCYTLLNIPNPDGSNTRVPLHVWCAMQDKTLDTIAAKVGLTADELAQVRQAAAQGAADAVTASAATLAAAVAANLQASTTFSADQVAQVEAALRDVLVHGVG